MCPHCNVVSYFCIIPIVVIAIVTGSIQSIKQVYSLLKSTRREKRPSIIRRVCSVHLLCYNKLQLLTEGTPGYDV